MKEKFEYSDFEKLVSGLRAASPLVHHITNYVTVNDCANITLAVGASPVMADDPAEAADMASMAQSLVINIGTLNARTVESMLKAGRAANRVGIPVILDPVGCGATPLRIETTKQILRDIHVDVIRGNISEIACIAGLVSHTKGVDASSEDHGTDAAAVARSVSEMHHTVTAVSGVVDIVTDGTRTFAVENGCAAMSRITGSGCMETSVLGSFCGAHPAQLFEAVLCGMIYMGLCGEIAEEKAGRIGLGAFRSALIDAAGNMIAETLFQGAKYREITL